MKYEITPVARIRSDFDSKFGIPRQPGIIKELKAEIVFEPGYDDREAIRGIEEFSHLWLIWCFSENADAGWSPTVRPPRLGGNVRKGVFATRSPYRPNALGLSCVKLVSVNDSGKGMPTLTVEGADLMDGTPIFDIKPYVPYTDAVPDAACGFAPDSGKRMEVVFPEELEAQIPEEKRAALKGILSLDPRPQYIKDPGRTFGFPFAGKEIRFTAEDGTIRVVSVAPEKGKN